MAKYGLRQAYKSRFATLVYDEYFNSETLLDDYEVNATIFMLKFKRICENLNCFVEYKLMTIFSTRPAWPPGQAARQPVRQPGHGLGRRR